MTVPDPVHRFVGPPGEQLAALRVIDANFNRAAEGLRVVEEYCRFVLGDRHLTERCKQLRHCLTESLATVPHDHLHAARETQSDVGTAIATPSEAARLSLAHIAAANWQRIEQALRAIEEYAKLVAADIAPRIEAIRYQAYTLAKACSIAADSQARLASARLYVLVDGRNSECEFVERVQVLIGAGVHVLQLRDKRLDDRTLLARARLLRRVIDGIQNRGTRDSGSSKIQNRPTPDPRPTTPLLVLNDRPDIALLARADGVHLGQNELTVHDARQVVGPEMLIGVSTHSIDEARQAVLDGASYLGCGPTFPSGTKRFDCFPGLPFLRQVAAEIALPAFAIGGITLENMPQVLATGFTRIAIGGAVATSPDPAAAIKSLAAAISLTSCQ